jgi:hypothetical protein
VVEEDGVTSDKLHTLQRILCLQDPEHTEGNEYKKILHEVARSWISDLENPNECNSGELEPSEKEPTPREPK